MATLRELSPSPPSPSHLAVQLDLVALHHLLDGGADIAEPDCSRGKGRGICMRGDSYRGIAELDCSREEQEAPQYPIT